MRDSMSPPQPAPSAPHSSAAAKRLLRRAVLAPEGSVIVDPDMGRGDLRGVWGARSIRGGGSPSLRRSDAGKAARACAAAVLVSASALRRGVALLLVAAAAASCSKPAIPAADRLVLVTIDTLRADRVGCYGDAHARTPVMDTLAAQGVRFEVAISPAPLTLPSHASLLTALDPPHHAVRHNSTHRLPEGVPTLASALHDAGYATAAFVGSVVLAQRYGLARGFDVYDDVHMERTSSQTSGYAERPANRVVDAVESWLANAPPRF